MKQLMLLGIVCLPLLMIAQDATKPNSKYQGIAWTSARNWNEVITQAKAENKYIFVDCYATWCGPCKKMDQDIYPLPRVGSSMNGSFISLKVQMDSTLNDGEEIKRWYAYAGTLMKEYQISGFPTYLFFSPDGKLVHKDGGYKEEVDFLRLLDLARDPKKPMYYAQYEAFKEGKKDYSTLKELAEFTNNLIGDRTTAKKMVREYINHVLNKLAPEVFMTKENLEFLISFTQVISSKDKVFVMAYKFPRVVDSIVEWSGDANALVFNVIKREQLDKVLKNKKALQKLPNWDRLQWSIAQKYPAVDARKLVLEYKINYYKDYFIDWELWARYKDEMINRYPPKPAYNLEVFMEINGHGGAWHAFLHCPDKAVLLKALEWAELAIELDSEDKGKRAEYFDTKANLLYKLGKKEEALRIEKEALELFPHTPNSEHLQNYQKMQLGEPTWEESFPNGPKL
ncbi:MAG TPA: thioredoxin fold domain-containing protein [Sphingobacteriaceae bacterium]